MAETLVENQVCQACGAEIRSGALFCYSCGVSVEPPAAVALKVEKNVVEKGFRDEVAEKNNGKPVKIEQPILGQIIDKPIPKPTVNEKTKLKSAAAMRRKSKIYQPKRVEIIWEDNENKANGWFIVVAIALTLLAAGIFYLAIYLK